MAIWDLPADLDIRYLLCTKAQFAQAIAKDMSEVKRLQEKGVVIESEGRVGLTLAPDLNLREMTVTQKQFAMAVGLSPARVNQLAKSGMLKMAPHGRRLMFVESMENFCLYQ